MIDVLLNAARAVRIAIYRLSSARVLGVDVDIVLHFAFGAAIFAWADRRMGAVRAAWFLIALIILKEVADLFLKSQLRYIQSPNPAMIADLIGDILNGLAGGLAAFVGRRVLERSRARPTSDSTVS